MWRWGLALVALAVVSACGAGPEPGSGPAGAADKAVREYIDVRNSGDLRAMLGKSCEGLYSSTDNLLRLNDEERQDTVRAMREHPVTVDSVTVDKSEKNVIRATMTGSANTESGKQTASQHVEIRQYRDGYRICEMKP
ncbi:hypothetical protein D5S17_17010 [Pseudonocardiaceae bacterium YIM PH 21723]|nr:hypothetical protein D5S17_17010 [Pseudonocardiaceae bacterium YIM PH 21723]